MHLKEELQKRGLLKDISNDKLFDIFEKGGEAFYCGFDPSADSLHLGNLCSIMAAINLMKRGNKFYLLIGGATGMIGDPGGKSAERNFLDEETLIKNQKGIKSQIEGLLDNLKNISGKDFDFEVINNYDWFKNISFLEFLRETGKFVTVNQMMTKETVKRRIEDPDKSISYTEFSYMLMQGTDFYKLFESKDIKLQIGGSDQWGNLVTGIELIRKKIDKEGYAMTFPLILDSTGKKFGKSEGNAIWLSKNKNSPYFVYQYFMNTTDEDVERFLKLFTILDFDQIQNIVDQHNKNPQERYGQSQLAKYVVELIFGKEYSIQAEKISQVFFGKDNKLDLIKEMNDEEINALYNETGGIKINSEINILDIITECGLAGSKGDAKKLIKSGAIYFNEEKIEDMGKMISENNLTNKVGIIRKGKKIFKLIIS